jgi:hypothetical protein
VRGLTARFKPATVHNRAFMAHSQRQTPLSSPATRLRQGFAGLAVSVRFSESGKRVIQHSRDGND